MFEKKKSKKYHKETSRKNLGNDKPKTQTVHKHQDSLAYKKLIQRFKKDPGFHVLGEIMIVGFSFNKILVEKTGPVQGKVNITNNVAVLQVEKTPLSFGANKQDGLRFVYEFKAEYSPNIGHILLTGDILFLGDEKQIKEVLESWKKKKQVPKDVIEIIINNVLSKCNIEALILSREINLPPPIPLPRLTSKKE